MKRKTLDKSLIVLLITTLIMFALWVGFEVYEAYIKMDIPVGLEKHMEPLNPQLNSSILDEIERMEP